MATRMGGGGGGGRCVSAHQGEKDDQHDEVVE